MTRSCGRPWTAWWARPTDAGRVVRAGVLAWSAGSSSRTKTRPPIADQDRGDQHGDRDGQAGSLRGCAEQCARRSTDGPERMEGRHDRPAVVTLDDHRLIIHGDVDRAVGESEDQQRESEADRSAGMDG